MRVGFIGCGNLGFSLVRGLLGSGALKAGEVIASDLIGERLKRLRKLGIKTTIDNKKLVESCEVVFLAVKPDAVESVLKEVEGVSKGKLFISVAAGVSTKFIEARTRARVARIMPNICGAVGEMASCFSFGKDATSQDQKLIKRLLGSIGITFKIDEKLMDAITGLSGSGPAYFYLFIRALQEAGVQLGLSSEVALKLAAQTAKGAGEMVLKMGATEDLTRQVCTPKGTTIEGIKVLEDRKVADAIKEAVKTAAKRARELSR
ncbi:MAG: pyrroline-5-carboxylate reductase [Hadesarchaea archaeon]|nr:pyrroline-5-carboxylate reductase [Hadesarchaea archaeon]